MLIIRLKISQSYFLIQVHHLHIQTRVAFDFRNGSTFLGLPEGQNMVILYGGTSVKIKYIFFLNRDSTCIIFFILKQVRT